MPEITMEMVEDAINGLNEKLKHLHYEHLCLAHRVGKLDGKGQEEKK